MDFEYIDEVGKRRRRVQGFMSDQMLPANRH